jgi:hypothetical protein
LPPTDECVVALELGEDPANLFASHDDRKSSGCAGAYGAVEPEEFATENFAIQEYERRERLVLRRGSDASLDRQVGEEVDDFGRSHLVRVSDAVMVDVTSNPTYVGLLRAKAHVSDAKGGSDAIQQSGGVRDAASFQGRLRPGPRGGMQRVAKRNLEWMVEVRGPSATTTSRGASSSEDRRRAQSRDPRRLCR